MTTQNTHASAPRNGTRLIVISVLILAAFFGAYKFAAALSAPANQAGGASGIPGSPVANAGGAGAGGGSCCGGGGGAPAGGGTASSGSASGGASSAGAAPAGGGGCCGGGNPNAPATKGTAKVSGNVQKISVDLSGGSYNPSEITLKAGVPAEITFGQGSGCLGQLLINDFGIYEDLTTGPKTVKLPALEKGTYAFSCGMQMVFGKIVVK